jgi:acetyl-CoA synthetase
LSEGNAQRERQHFWGEQGKRLDWIKPYTKVKDVSWETGDLHIKWYADGRS